MKLNEIIVMCDEQIIHRKSEEIKRLHRVCNVKDEAISKGIETLQKVALSNSVSEELRSEAKALAQELKECLG